MTVQPHLASKTMPYNLILKANVDLINPALGPRYTITGNSAIDGTVQIVTGVHRWAIETGFVVTITDDTIVSGQICNDSNEGYCQECIDWQCDPPTV
jgi:hypothetical protein